MGGWGTGREGRREKGTREGRGGHIEKREREGERQRERGRERGRKRERERERERQRQRQTDRQTDRDIERETDRQRWDTQRKRKSCVFFLFFF